MTGHPKVPLPECLCGRPMRRRDAVSCWRCLDKDLKRPHRRGQRRKAAAGVTIARHESTRSLVQHDAVAVRLRWQQAVWL